MLGLTSLGIVHTAISLIAVAAGAVSLIRLREISPRNTLGRVYVWTTVLTCLTGFPIMQHGGFGKPHVLGVLTLLVLALAAVAEAGKLGRFSRAVAVVGYSATFLFHLIPGFVETTTRIPPSRPWIQDREGPELQAITGLLALLFLAGATWQVRCLLHSTRATRWNDPSGTPENRISHR